jgi:hypothetical protein
VSVHTLDAISLLEQSLDKLGGMDTRQESIIEDQGQLPAGSHKAARFEAMF